MPIMKGDRGDYMMMKGQSGLQYIDENGTEYFIDCEMVSNEEYDLAIYLDSLELIDSDLEVTIPIKNNIKERIKKICMINDLNVIFKDKDEH